jgi:hypothetical protein
MLLLLNDAVSAHLPSRSATFPEIGLLRQEKQLMYDLLGPSGSA